MYYDILVIVAQSQRHVCQIFWLVRSLPLQLPRMSLFRPPVSALQNSVPGACDNGIESSPLETSLLASSRRLRAWHAVVGPTFVRVFRSLGALVPRSSDHSLHGFDEVSPRVDRPSLIETNRFIGSINHGVGRLRELRDDSISHAGIGVSVISAAPASGLSNSTCRSFTKGLRIPGHYLTTL